MFEIKVSRYHDGRYVAEVPDFHPHARSIEFTLEKAVRSVQSVVLNIASDRILHNREMPTQMREWFHVMSDEGKTNVGGSQLNDHSRSKLIHSGNDVIPSRHPSEKIPLPNLPVHGTAEYDDLMAGLNASLAAKI